MLGEDRWQFEAAGWYLIGLNSLIMNTGLASEAEQFDWLASQLAGARGKPVALFLHKPVVLDSPDDPELPASAIRFTFRFRHAAAWSRWLAAAIRAWSAAATVTRAVVV